MAESETKEKALDQAANPGKRKRKKLAERRVELRDELFPGAAQEVWHRLENDGFSTVPRLLPLISSLVNDLSKEGDPSSVYWDLWCRVFDEGFVIIESEEECAYSSGYRGTRAIRTWRERMFVLEGLGFIKIRPSGLRRFAHVLVVNPLLAVARLKKAGKPRIPDEWWGAYKQRADVVGAALPEA